MTRDHLRRHVAGAVLLHLLASATLLATTLPAFVSLVAARPPMRGGLEGVLVLGALAPPALPGMTALVLWWLRGPRWSPSGWWAAGGWFAAMDTVLRAAHARLAPPPSTLGEVLHRVLTPADRLAPLLPEGPTGSWIASVATVGLLQVAACLSLGVGWSVGAARPAAGRAVAPEWRGALAGVASAVTAVAAVRLAGPKALEAWFALVG